MKISDIAITHHRLTLDLGTIANAHLAAGLAGSPYLEFPCDPPAWTVERRDFPLTTALDIDRDGMIVLGEAPGLGFDLDEQQLADTRI